MIVPLTLVAFQAAPPPPPPDAKMTPPVLAFWSAQGITDAERRDWREAARVLLANELLNQAAENWSRSPALRQQRLQALVNLLQALLPYTSREENQRADLCAAGGSRWIAVVAGTRRRPDVLSVTRRTPVLAFGPDWREAPDRMLQGWNARFHRRWRDVALNRRKAAYRMGWVTDRLGPTPAF